MTIWLNIPQFYHVKFSSRVRKIYDTFGENDQVLDFEKRSKFDKHRRRSFIKQEISHGNALQWDKTLSAALPSQEIRIQGDSISRKSNLSS